MSDQRNLIIAIAVSLSILLGFQYFYELPRAEKAKALLEAQRQEQQANAPQPAPGGTAGSTTPSVGGPTVPGVPGVPGVASTLPAIPPAAQRSAALASTPRVKIDGKRLHGSINLMGGRLDDLTLADYRETLDKSSPEIVLLAPAGTPNAFYGEFGWAPGTTGLKVPDATTRWTASAGVLRPGQTVTLSWDNGEGLRFERAFALDDNYMFTVTQRVVNSGAQPAIVHPYALVSRHGKPKVDGLYILHEGPLGVFRDSAESDGTLKELSYGDLDGERPQEVATIGGWIGFSDKYWLTALIPHHSLNVKAAFRHTLAGTADRYQVDLLDVNGQTVAPGGRAENVTHFFAGAKETKLIDRYAERYSIARFDRAIDWGWFYFLTRPIFFMLDWFYQLIGNFGLAILALTVVVKVAFLPLAYKSYVSMSQMKELQPKMLELREKYGEDRQRMSQEMMQLYKREKINPAAGCLPILLQIPVFFALYKVLYISIEMRHAPFYGWIHDLSAPDPTTWMNGFGLLPWDAPYLGPLQLLSLGVWPILMGISMYLQMKMNPQPPDPVQAKIFMLMPIMFTFMLGSFAAGLVIYWTWNNVLSIAQQWAITRRLKARQAAAKLAKKT